MHDDPWRAIQPYEDNKKIRVSSWWSSGLEMTWIGALEGAVTYIIGIGLGRIGGAS
jgi:hypothetical protein